MRHVVVFGSIVLLLSVLLLSMPIASHDESETFAPRVIDGSVDADAVVCCRFVVEGISRTCAVPQGRSCEVCARVCGP